MSLDKGTFLRIKRKANEDVTEQLLLSAKRQRKEDSKTEEVNAVIRFVGTQKNKEDEISQTFLDKAFKKGPLHNPRVRTVNLGAKQRLEHKKISKNNRLKLVNDFRNLDESIGDHDFSFALYEIEEEDTKIKTAEKPVPANTITCNGVALEQVNLGEASTSKLEEYVYDLYYVHNLKSDDMMSLENPELSINLDLYYENQDEDDDYPEVYDDDDDSNDELNWRNDYPEESDKSSNDEQSDNSEFDVEDYCPREELVGFEFEKLRFD